MVPPKSLILVLICLFHISCAQSDDNSRLIANDFILKIKNGDFNGVYQSFSESRMALNDSTDFRILFEKCTSIIHKATYMDTNSIKIKNENLINLEGIQSIKTFTYPYIFKRPEMEDSTINILISISNLKLFNIAIVDRPLGTIFLEPPKTPHQDSFSFKLSELSWFRIWYESGTLQNEFGDQYGYYAVKGGKNKLTNCGLLSPFEQMLSILNTAKIDSIDFKQMNSHTTGNPEWIYLRLKFKNMEYSNLGEFNIIYCLTEEPGIPEKNFDYIILIHSESTRYFIKKDKYPELMNILATIARKDYGDCLEYRFH